MRSENYYDAAQVCLNGHAINSMAQSSPDRNQKFCNKCGSRTINECQHCRSPIRGHYHCNVFTLNPYIPPRFCHNCGEPYPWTESKLKAAHELIEEEEKLTQVERDILKQSIDDLVRDTAKTQVAALRFKKLLPKAGEAVAGAIRDIIVDIASETAKKILFP